MSPTTESVTQRLARLELKGVSEERLKTLIQAHAFVEDTTFASIAEAWFVSTSKRGFILASTVETYPDSYPWCRMDRSEPDAWVNFPEQGFIEGKDKKLIKGFFVDPGKWLVGWAVSTDEHRRHDAWIVKHVAVGGLTWTISNLVHAKH